MEEIIKLDTVGCTISSMVWKRCSVGFGRRCFGNKQDLPANVTLNYGLYALYLKQTKCGDLRYGRQLYDYQEGYGDEFCTGASGGNPSWTRMSVHNGRGWCFIPI